MTCFEINDFEAHFFSNFSEIKLRVRKGMKEGGVADAGGQKEEEKG